MLSSSFLATKWKGTGITPAMAKMSYHDTWLETTTWGLSGSTFSSPCATTGVPLARRMERAQPRVSSM
jgi:hypothetical protein